MEKSHSDAQSSGPTPSLLTILKKRRQGSAGIQSTPSFHVLLAEGLFSHHQAKQGRRNSSNLATRREGGKTPGPLIPFLLYSFISQPLESSHHFNLIQERGTKHRGPSLLHLHAKGDPHHCKLIKKLPLRCSAFSSQHQQLDPQSIGSTDRFIFSSALFSPLRRITLNWFEVRISSWADFGHKLYTYIPRQPIS